MVAKIDTSQKRGHNCAISLNYWKRRKKNMFYRDGNYYDPVDWGDNIVSIREIQKII